MKVLDLSCDNGHRFEGWFGSEADFQSQKERALIECPMCGSSTVTRLPSAPRLNVSGAKAPPVGPAAGSGSGPTKGPAHGLAQSRAHGADATAPSAAPGQPQAGQRSQHQPQQPPHPQAPADPASPSPAQWLEAVKHAIANTEDVGQHFAEEARRIHYGEVEERAIRGQATKEEARSLKEEGIEVVALPIPPMLKNTLQ